MGSVVIVTHRLNVTVVIMATPNSLRWQTNGFNESITGSNRFIARDWNKMMDIITHKGKNQYTDDPIRR